MNLNIYPNYSTPVFGKKNLTNAFRVVKRDLRLPIDNNLTSTTPNTTYPPLLFFNQKVAFVHFFERLKNIPEYIKEGKKRISKLTKYELGSRLNTLEYQEAIVDKILSKDSLISNPTIRKHLYDLVHEGFCYHNSPDYMKIAENTANIRLKLLDAYAKNPKIQQDERLNALFKSLFITNTAEDEEQLTYLLNTLNQNAGNPNFNWDTVLDRLYCMQSDKNAAAFLENQIKV